MNKGSPATEIDAVTLQIIRSHLISVVDEMEANINRTAYSPIVYEVKDYCAALLDDEGRIIAQARGGMPIFLSDMGAPVKAGIAAFGKDGFSPGDVVLNNHPYTTGQHLNNMVAFSPIYVAEKLVGFAAVRAHWSDIGGSVPGSFSTNSVDIYSEGLIFNCIKVVRGGKEDLEIMRFINDNTRFARETFGDLRSQVAACRIGERRLQALVGRYGQERVFDAIHALWKRSEEHARRQLSQLRDGVYSAQMFLDDDGTNNDPVHIRVRVEIAGDEMTVDLSESSPQVGGNINCGESAAVSAVRVAFKSFTAPDIPADEGSFVPLKVIVPPGRFLSAQRPAAMTQWSAAVPPLVDTVLLALSQADPDRVPAEHHGSLGPYIWVGPRADGRPFVHIDTCSGGWGASKGRDGGVGLKTVMHGDTFNVAIEIEEAMFPLRVESYELLPDTGGAGQWRGGNASARTYRTLMDLELNFAFERSKCPPWGSQGGHAGTHNHLVLFHPDGSFRAKLQKGTLVKLPTGTRAVMISGSGGGYGDPRTRDRAAVARDLVDGYVTPTVAESVYGYKQAGE